MSSLSKIARDDALLVSTDFAKSTDAPTVLNNDGEYIVRPVPSFWNFVQDDRDFSAPSHMTRRRSSDQTSLRS